MNKFVRPALCRLCECPAGSDGVRMSDVDIVKLSRWWGKALETEFEDEELEEKFFCQFCLWDAKFQGEQKGSDGCDWWTGLKKNKPFFQFYFEDPILQSCEVRISPLTLPPAPPDVSVLVNRIHSRRSTVTKCIYCGETFKSKSSAFRHTLQAHANNRRFWCFTCKLNFVSEDERKTHCKKFHPAKIVCHCCKKEVSPNSLLRHISENHLDAGENIFKCCGEKFLDQDALVKHFKSVKLYKSAVCVYCGKLCSSNSHLWHHMEKVHKNVAIKCNYWNCGKYFLSEDEKQRHVVEVHESKPGLVQCLYCQHRIMSKGLPYHISLQHHSEAIRCTFNSKCLTYFRSDKEREEHERTVHLTARLAHRPKCKECGRNFPSKINLRNHLEMAHKLNATICKIRGCSEYSVSDFNIKKHFQEKHFEDEARKKFQCNECIFKTKTLESLKLHIHTKHVFGKFQCDKCDKVCKSKNVFLVHIRSHHRQSNVCPHCGYEAKFIWNHFRIDPCTKCGFMAACRGLKKLHKHNCVKGNSI